MQTQVDKSANATQLQTQETSEPELKGLQEKTTIMINSLRDLTEIALSSDNEALKLSILKAIADSAFALEFNDVAISAYAELTLLGERWDIHQPFDAYENLSAAFTKDRDRDSAIEILSCYSPQDSSDISHLYNLARAYEGLEEYESAISVYEELLEAKVENSLVHRGLAEAYLRKDDIESAVREYEILKRSYSNTRECEEVSNMIKDKWDTIISLFNKFSAGHRSIL